MSQLRIDKRDPLMKTSIRNDFIQMFPSKFMVKKLKKLQCNYDIRNQESRLQASIEQFLEKKAK